MLKDDMVLDRAGCREKSHVVMLVFSHMLEGSVPCVGGTAGSFAQEERASS